MDSVHDRIRRYRLRAAEVSQIAESVYDLEARRALELLAERYERMAEGLEDAERDKEEKANS